MILFFLLPPYSDNAHRSNKWKPISLVKTKSFYVIFSHPQKDRSQNLAVVKCFNPEFGGSISTKILNLNPLIFFVATFGMVKTGGLSLDIRFI